MAYRTKTEKLLKSRIKELEMALEAKPRIKLDRDTMEDGVLWLLVIIFVILLVGISAGIAIEQNDPHTIATEELPHLPIEE